MRLRRMCLLILGFTISTGICSVWFVSQQNSVPVVKGYAEEMPLPIFVGDTELLAEQILTYEREYIEDTEFGEFVFVTGLILRNTSDKGVVRAKVKLTGESGFLEFDATYIPPGEAVMVLEKNRKETGDFQFYSCTGTVEYDENNWGSSEGLKIRCLSNDQIEITNTTDRTISGIQLYYKTVYTQERIYIGGITHCYRINALSAGKSLTVSPEYFITNRSEIVYTSTDNATPRQIRCGECIAGTGESFFAERIQRRK